MQFELEPVRGIVYCDKCGRTIEICMYYGKRDNFIGRRQVYCAECAEKMTGGKSPK